MVKSAWNSARDADQIFFIVDADKIIPGGMGPGRTGRKIEPLVHPVAPERLRFKKGSNEELIMNRLQVPQKSPPIQPSYRALLYSPPIQPSYRALL